MHTLGNDIIDLEAAASQSNWQRPGWLEKVCTPAEQDQILKAYDPTLTTWILWSMKESAYKAHQRAVGHQPIFNPKHYECGHVDDGRISQDCPVHIDGRSYITHVTLEDDHLYTWVGTALKAYVTAKFFLDQKYSSYEGLRDIEISRTFGQHAVLDKDLNGVPSVKDKVTQREYPISLTHHGKYGAMLYCPEDLDL